MLSAEPKLGMIEDEFDKRTLADMNVALQRACRQLPQGRNDRASRKFIGERIVRSSRLGNDTLTELTAAGKRVVMEFVSKVPNRQLH